jgi:CRP/FNR family transcriptional regulator, cyclic AMP receptor protein
VARKAKATFDARAFLARADGGVTVSIYRRGEVVFTQGDPADSIFFIQVGKVKVTVVSQQGKEAVIAFLEAGDFIGEGCLTGRPRRISTARALLDSVITRMERPTMVRMLHDEPNFSELFTTHLLARTLRVEEDLVDQLFNSSEKRGFPVRWENRKTVVCENGGAGRARPRGSTVIYLLSLFHLHP